MVESDEVHYSRAAGAALFMVISTQIRLELPWETQNNLSA